MILPPGSHSNNTLTSAQVHIEARTLLQDTFSDFEITGYSFTQNEGWDVLLYASIHCTSVHSACASFKNTPSSTWMYTTFNKNFLKSHDLPSLEWYANEMLQATCPKRLTPRAQKVAIDVVLIPSSGDEATDGTRRFQAKSSTITFFCYASAYVSKKHKCVTLCCTFVRADDTWLTVLKSLVERVHALDIRLKRLYLERSEFTQVAVLRYL